MTNLVYCLYHKKHTALKVKLVNVQLVSEDMNGISEYRILIATTINTMVTQAPTTCDDISWGKKLKCIIAYPYNSSSLYYNLIDSVLILDQDENVVSFP